MRLKLLFALSASLLFKNFNTDKGKGPLIGSRDLINHSGGLGGDGCRGGVDGRTDPEVY